MVLRNWYLLRSSWPRIVDLIYWPAVQMLMWGFLQLYLIDKTSMAAQAGGAFIGAVLLWDILFRGQIGFSISFLEEMWSQQSRQPDDDAAPAVRAHRGADGDEHRSRADRTGAGHDHGDHLLRLQFLGARLRRPAFFLNLILTSWSIGLLASGLVLKKGTGAEGLAWSMTFLLLPLCCVYYPLSTLPVWLQWIAMALPPTHVFEGLRALVLENRFDAGAMLTALLLNLVYFAAAATAFGLLLRSARKSGSLLADRRVTETTQLTISSGSITNP